MTIGPLIRRAIGKGRRELATRFQRRELLIDGDRPVVSFTFDDAPCSAFELGGDILRAHGVRATYYVSLGLLGRPGEVGAIGGRGHLVRAVETGHELGCHTFDHLDAWHASARQFIASVDANREALRQLLPGYAFRSFAYPKSGAKLSVKAALEERFDCCRGGGQTFNAGATDLNLLRACFLDRRAGVDRRSVHALIEANAERCGWLIFAAHDISNRESSFTCTTGFFETVVRRAVNSGARVLPVAAACALLREHRLD